MNSNRFKQNVTPEKDILDKYKQNQYEKIWYLVHNVTLSLQNIAFTTYLFIVTCIWLHSYPIIRNIYMCNDVAFYVVIFNRNSKLCLRLTQFTRVRTTSSSHHPLDPDDVEEDLPPPRTERELFSIVDHDDIDTRLGGAAPSDDYFFDEIYEKSAFVDETTHSSIKDLKLESERDNVPDLLFRSPR